MCSGVWGGFWGVGRLEEGSALRGFQAQVARRVHKVGWEGSRQVPEKFQTKVPAGCGR